jgi:hypothetical protein
MGTSVAKIETPIDNVYNLVFIFPLSLATYMFETIALFWL